MTEILNYWPMAGSTPRKTQIDVFKWMDNLPSHIKYILCEVPVGGGKSPIALNYSGYLDKGLGNSYILTPQKILQKQYEDSFNQKYIYSFLSLYLFQVGYWAWLLNMHKNFQKTNSVNNKY